ncbi:bifunctional DNA-binding transcriptional regulator/O6-methylguanine-DNA methyltransferase Ada [Candidimonas sp. SYP-B2681]|uniref:bifunctional DNA-binding transcriptional regulator/O6-methylguanine-DNA methyltransferase Ada n=1 Tax=Candidimonas sp. SYP-B2681 TaxID=2497686 RepID=UPI000F8754CB|nr:bifunctional DNA-binding transcriptional regulator/O6-methylguanine-DNA methyltransferase Ada [Candidimonas sp. SYP-B2681]RTZ45587.1 bifunctional DNA-binding transcriptional regulator/O6-methylguanine-DNA methyltransferase Ada [Candidimonas sp. SYP-B2681]
MKKRTALLNDKASHIEQDPRWQAVLARDPASDGKFVYAVRTTGVYCQPSSPTRRPKPANVEFFDTAEAARNAGYRPSARAAADRMTVTAQHASIVSQACRHIESAEAIPTLNELAALVGLSPFHFHRVFTSTTGLSPRSYALAHRASKVRAQLGRNDTITDAIYDAGFNSSSRFYETSTAILGMRPTQFRAGGVNIDIRFAVGECSLGAILVAQSHQGICAILMSDNPDQLARDLQDQFPKANLIGGDSDFEQWVAKVVGLIEAPALGLSLPLDVQGTAFQKRVWQALLAIPVGETASYSQIAARIGMPKAVRAVASACAANHLAVAIPCHRVVRSDGALSGYRWGVERKRELLERERNH